MRSRVLLPIVLLIGAALAGCASPGANTQSGLTLNRVVSVVVNDANKDTIDEDPYSAITSSFVIRVGSTSLAAAAATITYQDKTGANVTKPLTAFTTAVDLAPGTEVSVTDANLTSDATLSLNGVVVASRTRPPVDWWIAGGYPIGFRMEPGSTLDYAFTSSAREAVSLKEVESTTDEMPYRIDKLEASLGFTSNGTMTLAYASAPESITAETTHDARALSWTIHGKANVPILVDAAGTNLKDSTTLAAGIEVRPETGGTFDANGKLWWNGSLWPVRADLDGGSMTTKVDLIAWAPSLPETQEFSCAGKTRADACVPTEWDLESATRTEPIEADKENLDRFMGEVDSEMVRNLTRFFAEDLVPGDELRFRVDVTETNTGYGQPSTMHTVGEAAMRAVGYEQVTVGAGSFEALKVAEHLDLKVELGESKDASGKVTLRAFTIDQRFFDLNMWVQKDTFVPLRVEHTTPLDLNEVVDDVIRAMPDDAWTQAAIKPLQADDVDFTVQATSTLELKKMTGETKFAPWAVLLGFNTAGFLPATIGMGGLGGLGRFGGPSYGEAYPAPPYGDPYGYGTTYPTPTTPTSRPVEPRPEPATLSFTKGAATADSQDLVVTLVSSGVPYYRLVLTLDGEDLYDADSAPGWCVVVDDACDMESAFGEVSEGDTLRIMSEAVAGKTLTVADGYTDEVLTTVVLG